MERPSPQEMRRVGRALLLGLGLGLLLLLLGRRAPDRSTTPNRRRSSDR